MSASQFADRGSSSEIERLKLATAAALSAELTAQTIDPSKAKLSRKEMIAYLDSLRQSNELLDSLTPHFVQSQASSRSDSIYKGLVQNVGTTEEQWRAYRDSTMSGGARFKITGWRGVSVGTDKARVSVEGQEKFYLWSGKTRSTQPMRVELLLQRSRDSSHGWLVVDEQSSFTGDQG